MTRHGAVVYLEIPADDAQAAASFYRSVFGWQSRRRGDGALAFDDTTGGVSGAWRTGRPPHAEAGVLVYVNVDDVHAGVARVEAAGGTVVQRVGGDPGELTARFLDPHGNLLALYQEPTEQQPTEHGPTQQEPIA